MLLSIIVFFLVSGAVVGVYYALVLDHYESWRARRAGSRRVSAAGEAFSPARR